LRLVTTLPPKRIFGGNDFLKAREQSIALRKLGAVVHEFDTEAVYFYDQAKIEQQKHDVVAFRPDALISTPDAAFVLQGGMLSGSTNSSQNRHRNLFIDELELPAVLFWDPPLTKAAWYLLKPWPEHPQESIVGALNSLRWLFLNPNIVHFFPDTGHTQELGKLGIASFDETTWYGQAMGNAFVNSGLHANSGESYDEEVAFFGNIYLAAASKIPYSNEPGIAELRDHVRAFRGADWSLSAFQAYCDAIDALDLNTKSALRLDPDQSFYWRFLYEELSKFMSEDRLHILQSCGRPVAYYGNFNDPESNALMAGKYKLRGALPYDGSLADAFRRTRVTIDASSGPFINGFSVRLLSCFAAGGFVLTTRRADIFRAFGPLADEICYQSANEFGGKLEHFLAHDRKRREVTQEIGAIVRRDFTAEALFTRTLPVALEHLRAQGSSRNRNSSI